MAFKLNHLIIVGVVALFVGAAGIFTVQGEDWYTHELVLPPIIPPAWVFHVAWSIIGLCTALSVIITWNTFKRDALFGLIIALFIMNGILHVIHSYVFFVRHDIGNSFWVAAAVESSVLLLMILLWNRSRTAAVLLLPYALWLLFALYLNNDIWLINEAL